MSGKASVSPCHPKANKQAERINQSLKQYHCGQMSAHYSMMLFCPGQNLFTINILMPGLSRVSVQNIYIFPCQYLCSLEIPTLCFSVWQHLSPDSNFAPAICCQTQVLFSLPPSRPLQPGPKLAWLWKTIVSNFPCMECALHYSVQYLNLWSWISLITILQLIHP